MTVLTEPASTASTASTVGAGNMPMAMPTPMAVAGPMETEPSAAASPKSSPPRLMITKMVLENFKSYAGVKTIGPFHKCFSSVVGPNGSGKSNVIDAMLFVFGKRAKKLRLNKVSELIHSSAQFKDEPLTYAKVSVYFQEIIDNNTTSSSRSDSDNGNGDDNDNDNDYTVVPNSTIVVTRTATRDNTSQYKLNNKNCSFRQVASYLNSKGINLDNNRFLILQGEVEMISMMPPKGKNENEDGLLEYLEDIIGSNQYVDETNEAAEKVDALTELRQEKLNRVKAVEKEKDSLEGAKLEAEALLNKEREIRRKKNVLYQINVLNVSKELEESKDQQVALAEELKAEQVKLQKANDRVQEIEMGLSRQNSEYEHAHAELVQTKEEFASYERRDIQLREEIKHEKANKKKIQAKLQRETAKEEESATKVQEVELLIPKLESEIEELTAQKEEQDGILQSIFEESKGETESLRQELRLKKEELAPVIKERTKYQTALDTAVTKVKLLEDSTTRAKEQLEAAEKELAALDLTQDNKRANIASFEKELAEAKERVVEAQGEDDGLREQEKVLVKRNAELTAQAEESKASLQASNTRSHAVNGILKASRRGQELANVGVLGRLGDLACISEQYDIAVSTACGMLDHIVVQTTAGAQRCLEFLRKHHLGRANFIPLDKMKKGAHDRAVDTPEGAPRLFDLITPSNFAITPALYLGVGNTLVAPDLETATRWAYDFGKRWRVVTIDGNLIELSGTMQGGGKRVRRGGMKLQNENRPAPSSMVPLGENSEEECAKLEALAAKALQDLRHCRQQRRSLSDEIRGLSKRVKNLMVQIPKLSLEIGSCDTTREELSKRLPELRAQCTLSDADSNKLIELNEEVRKREADMSACALLASDLEGRVERLQQAILDAGGTKLKRQQSVCGKIVEDLSRRTKELNSSKVKLNSLAKAVDKAKKAREHCTQDLERSKDALQAKKDDFKKLENEALEVMQAYERVQAIEAEKREALSSVSKECEALKKSQASIKCIEVEMMSKLESCEKAMNENAKRMKHWKDQIDRLIKAEEDEDEDGPDESDDEVESEEDCDMDTEGAEVYGEESKSLGCTSKELPLPVFQENALLQYDKGEVKQEISILEKERDSIAKNANMAAIAEYKKKEKDYLARVSDLEEVTESRNDARKTHEDLRRLRLEMFMDGFGQITLKLKEMYQMITLGGDAELELVDSLDPFSEGIVFSVRPPKKSWKNISNLSGGEKTLSSLALVFALHHYKPTPLYVMDEIDAALDFKNVSIVANYIKDRTKNAQFIIISLRNNMFELADRLVGIYKTHNCTKSITIDPKAFSKDGAVQSASMPLNDRTNAHARARGEGQVIQAD